LQLPPFEEFESTITPELVDKWLEHSVGNTKGSPTRDELVTIALRVGYQSALGLLEHYHHWLDEHLNDSEDRP